MYKTRIEIAYVPAGNQRPVWETSCVDTVDWFRPGIKNKFVSFLIKMLMKRKLIEKRSISTYKQSMDYQIISITEENILELAREQMNYYFCRNKKITKILIGPRQLREVINQQADCFISFHTPFRTLLGVEIMIVPWLNGVLVIPE